MVLTVYGAAYVQSQVHVEEHEEHMCTGEKIEKLEKRIDDLEKLEKRINDFEKLEEQMNDLNNLVNKQIARGKFTFKSSDKQG